MRCWRALAQAVRLDGQGLAEDKDRYGFWFDCRRHASDELCQVNAVPCRRSRADQILFAANGTRIESRGEKKPKAITDDGFPLRCAFISGAVIKKILKSTAITCDEGGERGQWVIHTNTGGWIVNVETKREIPFRHIGNTYFMDAWVRAPDKDKGKDKEKNEVDHM